MGTIAEKLSYLNDTKELFKDRLNSLGAEITSSTTFRNYLNWLDTFYGEVSDKTDLSQNGVVGRTSQNTAILPSDYTQVDYIESSGTQYIDTGVNADYKLSVKTKIKLQQNLANSMSGAGIISSASTGANRVRHHFQFNNNTIMYWAGTGDSGCNTVLKEPYSDEIYEIFCDIYNKKYYINNQEITGKFNSDNFDTELNYLIFARNNSGTPDYRTKIVLYSCQLYYENKLVRDFIPCYRNSDNEVGLYDLVNDVFYTNQGTGAFTYGSVVSIPNPDYPQPINNLSGDVPYKVSGKNKFNPTYEVETQYKTEGNVVTPKYILNNNQIEISQSNVQYGRYFFNKLLLDVGTYTLSWIPSLSGTDKRMNYSARNLDTSNDIVINARMDIVDNEKYSISFTLNEKQYVTFSLQPATNDSGTLTLKNIQLEKNSTATSYEPYIEPQTFTIPLGDIELCKIDTYEDKIYSSDGRFYLYKNINKVIFDGSENWNYFNVAQGNLFRNNNVGVSVNGAIPISNYFIGVSGSNERYDGTIYYNPSAIQTHTTFDICTNIADSRDNFKAWLSEHNVVVYYVLATPTTTEITQENYPSLYTALKQIQDYLTAYKINKEFILGYSSPEIEY